MIANESLRQFGQQLLETISPENGDIGPRRTLLANYQFNSNYADDRYVWLTCVLALKAVSAGNFGVGSILVNGNDSIAAWGHNEVFNPHFRSDRHAEMVVMNKFEDDYPSVTSMKGYKLYTSLEPCPMCLARLITSGISSVLYAALDNSGGMVHIIKNLPQTWISLAKRNNFSQARCSQDLIKIAFQTFLLNARELNEKLKSR